MWTYCIFVYGPRVLLVVLIKANIPGSTLIAKEKSKKFEESIDLAVDSLKRQIEKIKTKKQE